MNFKKYFWIQFIFFELYFAFFCFAQENSIEREKKYLISQTIKLGSNSFKEAFFLAGDQHAIALSGNHAIEVFRIQNGKKARVIPSQDQNAISLLVHPGGRLAITGGEDETVRIWNTQHTTSKGILRGHLSPVTGLALDTGGEILASASVDGTVILWNLLEQKLINSAKVFVNGSVKSLSFHPQEKIIVFGGEDGTLQLRSIPDLRLILSLPAHNKSITELEFNNRGDIFVSSSEDGNLIIWNWKEKKSRNVINFKEIVSDLHIHPRKPEMAIGTISGKFEIWNLENGEKKQIIKKFKNGVDQVKYDNSGMRILTTIEDGSLYIWEYMDSLYLKTLVGHERTVESINFSSNSKFLISSSSEKLVRLWDFENKTEIEKFDMGNHRVQEVRFLPKSQNFATAGSNGLIKIWDYKEGSLIRDLKFHKGKINSLSFHPKESVLLSVGSDKKWVLWDFKSGKILLSGSGHDSQILTSEFSFDGEKFATAGSDFSVVIWSYNKGEELFRLDGHKKAITTLAFSPDGKYLASGSQDKRIILWKIEPEISKNPYLFLDGHEFIVNKIFFSKDGKSLISVSKDKTMRLWQVQTGKLLRIIHGDSTPLVSAAISPNGEFIALSNLTKDILIFEFPKGIKELDKNIEENSLDRIENKNLNVEKSSESFNGDTIISMDDLKETNNKVKSLEELRAYALPESEEQSVEHIFLQKRLNNLLKEKNTCHNVKEIEELSLKILKVFPSDLAAYHSLIKVSIVKRDFNILKLLLMLGYFAEFEKQQYNYLPSIEIKDFFDKLRFGIFDQSFVRRGNYQKIESVNCSEELLLISFSDISLNLHYPIEFLKIIAAKTNMIDLRDFMGLDSKEFQNRMLAEIKRVIENGVPHYSSRLPRAPNEQSESIPFGILKVNFEKLQTFKNDGVVTFFLRKEGGEWYTYNSDMDNQIVMNLQAGRYAIKVSEILRKTFNLKSGTTLSIDLE